MIVSRSIEILRSAFVDGLSTAAAAERAGCDAQTGRRYRNAMERLGLIPKVTIRRFRDGRLADVSNIGGYAALQASQARKSAKGSGATVRLDTRRRSVINTARVKSNGLTLESTERAHGDSHVGSLAG